MSEALSMSTAWSHTAAKLTSEARVGMPRDYDGSGTRAAITVRQLIRH